MGRGIKLWWILNNRRTASPLSMLVEREERWDALTYLKMFIIKIKKEPCQKRTVTCMVLKATAYDMCTSSPLPR
ncbi:hypothetical protein TNCV_3120491 [Trichonephila clavipes]|uniref:Uncharacterized protein n=1 Tax=Trichonephila clavipes TaxID=2585209 RepID=A0A8X7BHQ0_TRICX|nr:hypothetical protein TNCV_3120491 [Trichonephila clavipes]